MWNPGIQTVDLVPFCAETSFLWRFRTESVSQSSIGYSLCAEGMLEPSFSHEEQIHPPAASTMFLPSRFTCICSRFPELIESKNQVVCSIGSAVEM